MADLDDFFAKRDKKKTKGKKFDTTEDLAKVLDQRAKEKKKLETGKSNYAQEGRNSPGPGLPAAGEDDEWLEAEDKAPDYTGLKIQELVLSSDDEEQEGQEGKEGGVEGSSDGPWKKKTKSKEEEPPVKEGETTEETNEQSEEKEKAEGDGGVEEGGSEEGSKDEDKGDPDKKSAYVPPSKRLQDPSAPAPTPVAAAPAATSSDGPKAYVPPSRRGAGAAGGAPSTPIGAASSIPKKKLPGTVPTLEDAEAFPSLS